MSVGSPLPWTPQCWWPVNARLRFNYGISLENNDVSIVSAGHTDIVIFLHNRTIRRCRSAAGKDVWRFPKNTFQTDLIIISYSRITRRKRNLDYGPESQYRLHFALFRTMTLLLYNITLNDLSEKKKYSSNIIFQFLYAFEIFYIFLFGHAFTQMPFRNKMVFFQRRR